MSVLPHIDFRDVRVIVVHPRDHDGELLIRHLQRLGCRVGHLWPPGPSLEGEVDVLLCLVAPAARTLLDCATAQVGPAAVGPAVIGLVDPRGATAIRLLHEATPHAVISLPFDPATLLPALIAARNNLRYQRRLLSKVAKLEETLRSFRKVERAKAILMEKRKMREPEAYSYLREQAMRRRVPIGVIASVVVDSEEMLPGDNHVRLT